MFDSKTDAMETCREYIKKFRKEDVEISIYSLDNLYKELDSYDNIDESVREQILAKATDDVIIQFLTKESLEFLKINDLSEQNNSFDLLDEKANHKGEKIVAEAILKTALPAEDLDDINMGKRKFVMSVEQGREIQHTFQTGMMVYQRARVYAAKV